MAKILMMVCKWLRARRLYCLILKIFIIFPIINKSAMIICIAKAFLHEIITFTNISKWKSQKFHKANAFRAPMFSYNLISRDYTLTKQWMRMPVFYSTQLWANFFSLDMIFSVLLNIWTVFIQKYLVSLQFSSHSCVKHSNRCPLFCHHFSDGLIF